MKIDSHLIEKYNVPVPRYTSYPPANFFHADIEEQKFVEMIEQSNAEQPQYISFYVHIPFCAKICHFCGCNAQKATKKDSISEYVDVLKMEIQSVLKHLDKNRKVSQIHYGGGTPNAIDAQYLKEINQLFFDEFEFIEHPEIAIECNPAHLDYKYIDQLIEAKFNRFSIGIQDFDTEILKTVNREPSFLPVEELVSYIRSKNSEISINLDFIYGLPGQTLKSFRQSIQRAIGIRPDRLVTFSYAHVPWVKKHQKILERKGLPDSTDKLEMFLDSRQLLLDAGYQAIGLDHYVLPNDELNIALIDKKLHRNFQGYCTRKTTGQVYAFGVSAISQLENGYIQNHKDLDTYLELVRAGKFPYHKGYQVDKNQKIIREAITEVMCNYHLDIHNLSDKYGISVDDFKDITKFDLDKINRLSDDNLLTFNEEEINVSPQGGFFIRNIAVLFDPNYINQTEMYSKSV